MGFIFGGNTGVKTPQELAERRELARVMAQRATSRVPQDPWEGLVSLAQGVSSGMAYRRLDKAEEEGLASGKSAYQPLVDAMANNGSVSNDAIMGALDNPWLTDPQKGIASALLKQNLETNAPLTAWQKAQLAVDEKRINQMGSLAKYGLNPVWGVGPNGETQIFQLPQAGGVPQQVQFPPGFKPTPGVSYQNLGTSVVGMDTKTGLPVSEMPVDVAGKAAQDAQGEAKGKAIAAAPGDYQAAQNALDLIAGIRTDPNKSLGTGFSSYGNLIRGTPGYDFQNKVEQAKSGAFLTAIQQMRGLGALSNAEGQTATAAVNRMNTASSEAEFNAALGDYEKIVQQGMAKAQTLMQGSAAQQGASQNAFANDPQFGQEVNGFKIGATAKNPQTGETIVWDGNGWRSQ